MRDVTLAGGFHCCLTNEESNAWIEYIGRHPDLITLRIYESQRCRAEISGCDDVVSLVEAEQSQLMRLYELGKAWHAETVAKRSPEDRAVAETVEKWGRLGG